MEHLLALIIKFNKGNATDLEKKELLQALSLEEHELKNWLEVHFERDVIDSKTSLSSKKSAELLSNILKSIDKNGKTKPSFSIVALNSRWNNWVAAACITGVLVISAWMYSISTQNSTEKNIASIKPTPQLIQFINSAKESKTTTLADGSIVKLEPNSTISYLDSFTQKRDISLIGKASFKVAKNAAKPFTVYANGTATTALGTEFSINATSKIVEIKLFEGKVVVASTNAQMQFARVYLLPGEQFAVNKLKGMYTKSNFIAPTNKVDMIAKASNKQTPISTAKQALTFNKTPLANVFEKVGKQYNKLIQFNKADFGNATFTGSFLATDSLNTILEIICSTNDLSFKEELGIVIISK
jgi:transmembrane sensor